MLNAVNTLIIFLLLTTSALADCTVHAHMDTHTEYAIFHSPTDAKVFSDEHKGEVGTSLDGGSYYVAYPVSVAISSLDEECERS